MARAAAKVPGTAVVNWDERFATEADVAAEMEKNSGGGQWFSVRGGVLTLNQTPIPGNEIVVVIVDSMLENCYYEGAFDQDNPAAPTCFAFGRDDDTLAPHETVFAVEQAQNETCKGCPMNVFGTANLGKGKACKNTRRLALLPAGTIDIRSGAVGLYDTEEEFSKEPLAFIKLPVTSVNGYAAMVKQISATQRRPPHGIYTRIKVIPDPKTQFRVLFEPAGKLPNEVIDMVMKKREEAMALIDQPYSLEERAPAAAPPPAAARRQAKAAAPVKGRAAKY